MINALFWRIAGLSLACSAVLLPLWLASRFIRRRYSPRACYALWLLLALRLMLPVPITQSRRTVTVEVPRYEIALSPRTQADPGSAPAKSQLPADTETALPTAGENAAAASTVSLTALLPYLWVAGMAVCGLWLALTCFLARRRLAREAEPAGPEDQALLDTLARELNCRRRPALCRWNRVSTPLLLGILRPVVVVPRGSWTRPSCPSCSATS